MAYKKKSTRGVKSPALKKAESQVEKLTAKLEATERELAEAQHSAKYWENRSNEYVTKERIEAHKLGVSMGQASGRENVIVTAAIRAHRELSDVKAQEQTVVALQRILGSVQGGLGVALEMSGRLEGGLIDLYPEDEDARRRLDAVRNTVCHTGRY